MLLNQEAAILKSTEKDVFGLFEKEHTGHDWWHIYRVRNLVRMIGKEEKGTDFFICEMAALLHDLPDEKLRIDGLAGESGEAFIQSLLNKNNIDDHSKKQIFSIIMNMSYKGGTNHCPMETIEGKIVQDADRLDAMGAIGIARTMVYSGAKGRIIHDPDKLPREKMTLAEYRSGEDTAIMHFYEKLLKLKSQMNTSAGRKLADRRHAVMENYLTEFFYEWNFGTQE